MIFNMIIMDNLSSNYIWLLPKLIFIRTSETYFSHSPDAAIFVFWLGRWGPSGLQQLRRSYETPLGVWTVSFQPAKVAPPSEVMSSDVAPSAKMSRGMVSTSKYTLHKIARLISTYGSTGIPRSGYPHQKALQILHRTDTKEPSKKSRSGIRSKAVFETFE